MNEQYVRTASFEVGEATGTGAGTDRVAVATDDRRVEFAGPDGRTTATLDAVATDLALGTRAYAVCGTDVVALSYEGTRVWQVTVDDARAIEVLPDPGVVAVLTGADLVGLDAETGGERFRTPRPHADVADVPGLVAGDSRIYLSAWSFLSAFDRSGDALGEANLAGAIDQVGVLEDLAIAAMKDGRLIGVDPTSDAQRFELDRDASWLAPRGTDALPCIAGNDLVSVDAEGAIDRLDRAPDGDLVVSADGDVACVVADGTVDVYRTRGEAEALEADLEADVIAPDRPLDLTLSNRSDQRITTTPEVRSDHAAFGSLDHLSIEPDGETAVSVPVRQVDPDVSETNLRLSCDGTRILETTVGVEQPDETSVTAEVKRIADGEATVELTVEAGANEQRSLRVEPGGATVPAVAPDDNEAHEFQVPLGTGALQVIGDDVSESVTIDVPQRPFDTEVSVRSGFVDVRVENAASVPIEDDLLVETAWLPEPVERPIALEPGAALVLVLPALEEGTQSIEVELTSERREHTVDIDEPLALGRRATAGASATQAGTAGSEATAAAGGAQGGTDLGGGTSRQDASGTMSSTGDRAGSLTASRTLSTHTVSQTRALVERITVEHDGTEPTNVTLVGDGTRQALGDVRPGTEYTVLRWHAFTTTGERDLPEVEAQTDTATSRVPQETVTVDDAMVRFGLEFRPGENGGELRLSAVNEGQQPCTVHQVRLRGFDDWVSVDDLDVPPSSGATWEATVRDDIASDADAAEAFVNYTLGGESGRCGTLAHVRSGETGLDVVEVAVHERTEFVEGYGSLALTVRNDGPDALESISIQVQGDALDEFLRYEPEEQEHFEPGASFVHEAPIKTDVGDLAIPVRLEATIDGDAVSEEFRVAGPVPDDEWTAEVQDAWSVRRENGGEAADARERLANFPSHLIGAFRES